jgi:predicted deacylase
MDSGPMNENPPAEKLETKPIEIGSAVVAPGENRIVELPIPQLYTHTHLALPVHVVNAKRPGPTLFLTAALHGDELNGVNIVRRVLAAREFERLRGRVIAVPIVNIFGFINRSRYLPDRRDLNRSFPGTEKGSITARLANLVAKEIVSKADFGIDLHTAAIDRDNLPHIRGDLSDPVVLELAKAFGAPVVIDSKPVEGSLREFAAGQGIPTLLYEAGEALRFGEIAIRAGVQGVLRVMRALGMLPQRTRPSRRVEPVVSYSSTWLRAPRSGIFESKCRLGERVSDGQELAVIGDPFGTSQSRVVAHSAGVVIGRSELPLAHEGDALFHIAQFSNAKEAEAIVEEFQQAHAAYEPLAPVGKP